MKRLARLLALMVLALAARPAAAAEDGLYVDLSSHVIEIGSRFSGASLIMFGAVTAPGDIVVVVRGPESDIAVRRKARSAGLWLNRDSMTFVRVPQFYAVAATAPLDHLLPDAVRAVRQIGIDRLALKPAKDEAQQEVSVFRSALIREREREALYLDQIEAVSFIDTNLFRVNLELPADVPTGRYQVEIFLVRNSAIVAERTTPLSVIKTGLSAEVYDFAHNNGIGYAAIAVAAALLAGWLGYALFRKV